MNEGGRCDRPPLRPLPRPLQQQQQKRHISDLSDPPINETHQLRIPEDLGFSAQEWGEIQKALQWGEPDRPITSLTMSTSPNHSTFGIDNLKNSYRVGEELLVTITAKDFAGRPKRYGGDFFQAKVYSDTLKVVLSSLQFSSFFIIQHDEIIGPT